MGVWDWGLPGTLLSRVMTLRMLLTVFKKNLFLNNCKVIEKLQIQCREFCIFLSPIPPVWVRVVLSLLAVYAFLQLRGAGAAFHSDVRASHCGFSCCRVWAPGCSGFSTGGVVV